MITSLVLLASLSSYPAQAGNLKLTNDRLTYGILGAVRKDATFYPDDFVSLTFDIEDLSIDDSGKVQYSISMEVKNKKGQKQYAKEAVPMEAFNALGGTKLPAFASWQIPSDAPKDEYTLDVTVTDKANKKSKTLSKKFNVDAKAFGLVRVYTSYDGEGKWPSPQIGVAGQVYYINFSLAGFTRNNKKEPSLELEMVVIDDATKKPTVKKPSTGKIPEANGETYVNVDVIPLQYRLPLNQPGKYTVKITAKDKNNSNKEVSISLPIQVVESK